MVLILDQLSSLAILYLAHIRLYLKLFECSSSMQQHRHLKAFGFSMMNSWRQAFGQTTTSLRNESDPSFFVTSLSLTVKVACELSTGSLDRKRRPERLKISFSSSSNTFFVSSSSNLLGCRVLMVGYLRLLFQRFFQSLEACTMNSHKDISLARTEPWRWRCCQVDSDGHIRQLCSQCLQPIVGLFNQALF